jgi:glycerol-3-phosphate acyltransferase PlsY
VGDLLKGVAAVIFSILFFRLIAGEGNFDEMTVGYISGFFAIIGHIFPVYYRFKGGKGVLVSCSILLVIDPVSFCVMIPFFALILLITRYVSVASITAAAFYPAATFLLHYFRNGFPLENCLIHTALTLCTGIVLILMHKENIRRLRAGTEHKFSRKNQHKA